MNYQLENLGPERFQEVCHALLVKAFPNTQCFPVGQRDAGRDAVSYLFERSSDDFIVYQVKFSRKPLAEKEPHEWLKRIIDDESPKLSSLIPKGAVQYIILTNVPGTAYPNSGSIDHVQKMLADNVDVPSQCWWRDDINRRLDDAWNIKWAYPEILTGTDVLKFIVESDLAEERERRTSALRAYTRDQFDREEEVKFKQVELQNKVLDLFIDVPVIGREPVSGKNWRSKYRVIEVLSRQLNPQARHHQEASVGAATLLLHPLAQEHLTHLVLEGAPGQGKSTIAQYLCQIHRRRILEINMEDARIPANHRSVPIRFPFRIDCRDFSLWLNKQNPFSADEAADVPASWQKSLEAFVAAHVEHFSGGAQFSVADLHAVLKLTPILLVFDGLDEVADIKRRSDVVDHIIKGVNRLNAIAVSTQTLVTSRPAAFANSPGLPEDSFLYLHLTSIDSKLIQEYAEKWLKARKLDGKDAADVRKILRNKLDQPHLRELARNPMQLAILLSLIQTRGGSLPDKRTALYDNYVDLFFNRESEKSTIVRDHRDLLIDIHRYLAWILHAESQTKQNRGSVTVERLRQLVEQYLSEEGHPLTLVPQLFTGMVERVVALVSRVEGTYEFEVQPLREYFAARHLYHTARYSPPGAEKKGGTLPDRFDALSRDFFWSNVTRFYAGCYSKGELPSLVDRLEVLANEDGYKFTSHPRFLAATLLGDWVFTQHPKSMRQVVSLVLDKLGLRFITSGGRRYRRGEPLVLPKGSGNEELIEHCFELLETSPPSDFSWMLIELLRANSLRSECFDRWRAIVLSRCERERTRWVEYGINLGVLSLADDSTLNRILDDNTDVSVRLDLFVRGGRSSFVESNQQQFEVLMEHLLDSYPGFGVGHPQSLVEMFMESIHPAKYSCAFRSRDPIPLSAILNRMLGKPEKTPAFPSSSPIGDKCLEIIDLSQELSSQIAVVWASELKPWNTLVESLRASFGERWAFKALANISAGIRSKDQSASTGNDLLSENQPLCERVRYARLKANAPTWWLSTLNSTDNQESLMFVLLVYISWAGPTVLEKHASVLDDKLKSLSPEQWHKLYSTLMATGHSFAYDRREINIDIDRLPKSISERTAVILTYRVNDDVATKLYMRYLSDYQGSDPFVLGFSQHVALRSAQQDPATWEKWLKVIARAYYKIGSGDRYFGFRFARAIHGQTLPLNDAEEIAKNCDSYPVELVGLAEETCRERIAERIVPVGTVAEGHGWFESED